MNRMHRWIAVCALLLSVVATGCPGHGVHKPADARQQIENFGWAMTESNWVTPAEEVLAPWLDVNEAETAGNAAMDRTLESFVHDFTPVVQEMNVDHGSGPLDSLVSAGFPSRTEITADNLEGWGTAEFIWEADSTGAEPAMFVRLLVVRTDEGVRIGSYAFGDSAQ